MKILFVILFAMSCYGQGEISQDTNPYPYIKYLSRFDSLFYHFSNKQDWKSLDSLLQKQWDDSPDWEKIPKPYDYYAKHDCEANFLSLLEGYEEECYADSFTVGLPFRVTTPVFAANDTIKKWAIGYKVISETWTYGHTEPTFKGFINYLRKLK